MIKSAVWPTIDPSILRHQGRIQSQSVTHDISGGQISTWTTIAIVRMAIDQATHSERATAEQLTAQCTHTIVMRWNAAITVTPGMRVVIKGDQYLVQATDNVQQRGIILKLFVLSINQGSN